MEDTSEKRGAGDKKQRRGKCIPEKWERAWRAGRAWNGYPKEQTKRASSQAGKKRKAGERENRAGKEHE